MGDQVDRRGGRRADIVKVMGFLRGDERCQFWSFVDAATPIDGRNASGASTLAHHSAVAKLGRVRVKIEVG